MPTTLPFVFAPEDERQFLNFLAPYGLTAYPDRIPPDWQTFVVDAAAATRLDQPAYYLAAESMAPLSLRTVKRGREQGTTEIDERQSPVLHYQRSFEDEEGQLRSGRVWCELNLSGDMQKNKAFPDAFRRLLAAVREHLHTRCHRSDPTGWWVGPQAARLAKSGKLLREEGRKGCLIRPYK